MSDNLLECNRLLEAAQKVNQATIAELRAELDGKIADIQIAADRIDALKERANHWCDLHTVAAAERDEATRKLALCWMALGGLYTAALARLSEPLSEDDPTSGDRVMAMQRAMRDAEATIIATAPVVTVATPLFSDAVKAEVKKILDSQP